jgi:hypothetical protein
MLLEQEGIYREIYPHHSSGRVQSNALKIRGRYGPRDPINFPTILFSDDYLAIAAAALSQY